MFPSNLSAHPEVRGSSVSTPFTQTKSMTKIKIKDIKTKTKTKAGGRCVSTPFTHLCPLPATSSAKTPIFPAAGLSDQFGKQRIIQLTKANGSKKLKFLAT